MSQARCSMGEKQSPGHNEAAPCLSPDGPVPSGNGQDIMQQRQVWNLPLQKIILIDID